jgi:HEAT repeat protein
MTDTVRHVAHSMVLAAILSAMVVAAESPSSAARQAADQVLAFLAGADPDARAIALDRVRHGLGGEWFTRAVADKLPALEPETQVVLLLALADRGDPAAVPAARGALDASKEAAVRAAALRLVGRLGGSAEAATLVTSLAAADPERAAARRGLVEISGAGAAEAVRSAAAGGTPAARAVVIDVLAERRDRGSLPILVKAAVDDDAAVRQAAMRALARFGGAAEVPAMVDSLLKATGDERKNAELAITAVCATGRDASNSVAALVDRYAAAGDEAQRALLPALARVGGPQVMAIVDAMVVDPAKRSQGLDALSKWPDATVKDRLLDLLAAATDDKERELLLGALIRIAPLPDNKLNDGQKLELLTRTMALCRRNEDRARILQRANAIRTIETFRFVAPYLDDPALAEAACRSVVELAHHQKLRDAHKAEFAKALDQVLGITKNEELIERATRYKAGQTWDRRKKG